MKKKKIAFIEMETHSALLEQWYLLLKEMDAIDFQFFVHEKVRQKISSIPHERMRTVASVSDIDFSGFDGVVVNTMHRNFDKYADVLELKPTLILLHNLNFSLFFKSLRWKNFLFEKERFIYYLKLYLLESVGQRRKVVLKADRYGVLSHALLNEVKRNGRFTEKTEVVQFNYCKESIFPQSEVIHIVMPGNVSNKRKDVAMLFEILPKLNPVSKLHFTFLGKPENDEVLKALERLKTTCNSNITISHYHRFIPWEEYSAVIAHAHLLLCPIKSKTSFYWVEELYGKTKISGSEADCIHNGKIGLFPKTYPKMDWHNLFYNSPSELTTILNTLTIAQLESEYHKLVPYTEKYTFEKVKNKLEQQLLQLTELQ